MRRAYMVSHCLGQVVSLCHREVEQYMPTRPRRPALHPTRIRAARAQLLAGKAAALADRVRVVLCEPTRTQIVRALSAGALTVTDLAGALGRGRTVISRHLRVLRTEGVVQPDRRGRLVYYALTATLLARSSVRAIEGVAQAAD